MLLALVPASRVWSLDGRRNPASAGSHSRLGAVGAAAQVAIPYFFGGIAKLNADWLHGQPMQLWMSRMEGFQQWIPGWGEHWLALVFSCGGLVLDLAIVPLLLWRRTRLPAFCLAVGFHLMNALMWRIGIFPWLMIAATTLFFDPDWPRRWVGGRGQGTGDRGRGTGNRGWQSAIPALLVVFFAVQLLVPLRHWAYPGNVDWTEEGSHFSWRMMLADKAAALRITVVDPATGEVSPFDPRPFLTPKQLDKLAVDPENLREFAAAIKADLVRRGEGHKEVRVFALCSLNGRKPQPLVDPSIDLGAAAAHAATQALDPAAHRAPPRQSLARAAKPVGAAAARAATVGRVSNRSANKQTRSVSEGVSRSAMLMALPPARNSHEPPRCCTRNLASNDRSVGARAGRVGAGRVVRART